MLELTAQRWKVGVGRVLRKRVCIYLCRRPAAPTNLIFVVSLANATKMNSYQRQKGQSHAGFAEHKPERGFLVA